MLVGAMLGVAMLLTVAEMIVSDACDSGVEATTVRAVDVGTDRAPTPDGYPVHLCHCAHVHAAAIAARAVDVVVTPGRSAILIRGERVPVSIARTPPLRPPARVGA